jgi:hypothetical protein
MLSCHKIARDMVLDKPFGATDGRRIINAISAPYALRLIIVDVITEQERPLQSLPVPSTPAIAVSPEQS